VDDLDRTFDVVVVGSGAAGSIAAKELTERGLEVLVLEAGPGLSGSDFINTSRKPPKPLNMDIPPRARAFVSGQHMQARRAVYVPAVSHFLVNDRQNPYVTHRGERYLWIRGRVLGGRLNTYGRVLMRMSDTDFAAGSRDGLSADWPVCYADLASHYDQVERFLGLYGSHDDVWSIPDGSYTHPARLSPVETQFRGQVQEHWPERRVIPWRYAAPNLGRIPRGIAAAQETGRMTLRTDAVVRRITVGPSGRADGAQVIDRLTKKEFRVKANVVMLCASAIESVRLLLNSGTGRHPGGLANSSGLVGRYFMDQTPSIAVVSIPDPPPWQPVDPAPADTFYAPAGGAFIPRFVNRDGGSTAGFARGFALQGVLGRMPVPEDSPAVGGLMGFGEMLPYASNRITVHQRRTDAWGIPVPVVRCVMGSNERALLQVQVHSAREMLQDCGYRINFAGSTLGLDSRDVWPGRNPLFKAVFRQTFPMSFRLGAAIHECGGVRMGSDPATSVLNEHNQSWDVPNLFVTDGSSFVTSGSVGPSLTIMALTARACGFIAKNYSDGSI
jgi:choline dehydrogenase-like flavoprotein